MRYDTTAKNLFFCNGTAWTTVGGSGSCTTTTPDPNLNNVSLLLKANGSATNNHTFVDSSPNNIAITRYGNTTQGSYGPYSGMSSAYFDGSGDYLAMPTTAALAIATNDFTIEFWVYYATSTGGSFYNIYDARLSNEIAPVIAITSDKVRFGDGSNDARLVSSSALNIGSWNHVAIVRSSAYTKIYINGTLNGNMLDKSSYVAGTPISDAGNPETVLG